MKIIFLIVTCLFFSKLLEAQSDSITISLPVQEDTFSKAACYNRGLNFYQAKEFLQAILCFDSCLTVDSFFTDARFAKAISLEKQGDLKSAVTEFERIQAESPDYDEVDKRLSNYYLTKYLSKNWYYMLAMLLLVVLIMAAVVKSTTYKRG